jgi:hypothetical protein
MPSIMMTMTPMVMTVPHAVGCEGMGLPSKYRFGLTGHIMTIVPSRWRLRQ